MTVIKSYNAGEFSGKNAGTNSKGTFSKKAIYESRILIDHFEQN
jgi:hypothetical protein